MSISLLNEILSGPTKYGPFTTIASPNFSIFAVVALAHTIVESKKVSFWPFRTSSFAL